MSFLNNKLLSECTAYDFKRELERKKKGNWLKSVSAFANTSGGTLFFGVNDDASIVGLDDIKSDSDFISEAINTHLDPIPNFTLVPEECDNGNIILVLNISSGNHTPYYLALDGKKIAYIRLGNESVPANSHQLYNLVLKGSNKSWDSLVTVERRQDYSFTYLEREYPVSIARNGMERTRTTV